MKGTRISSQFSNSQLRLLGIQKHLDLLSYLVQRISASPSDLPNTTAFCLNLIASLVASSSWIPNGGKKDISVLQEVVLTWGLQFELPSKAM